MLSFENLSLSLLFSVMSKRPFCGIIKVQLTGVLIDAAVFDSPFYHTYLSLRTRKMIFTEKDTAT